MSYVCDIQSLSCSVFLSEFCQYTFFISLFLYKKLQFSFPLYPYIQIQLLNEINFLVQDIHQLFNDGLDSEETVNLGEGQNDESGTRDDNAAPANSQAHTLLVIGQTRILQLLQEPLIINGTQSYDISFQYENNLGLSAKVEFYHGMELLNDLVKNEWYK